MIYIGVDDVIEGRGVFLLKHNVTTVYSGNSKLGFVTNFVY